MKTMTFNTTTMELLYDYTMSKYLMNNTFAKLCCFVSGGKKAHVLDSLKNAKVILDLPVDYELVTDDKSFKVIESEIENDNTVTYVIQFSKLLNSIKRSLSVIGRGYIKTDEKEGYLYARNVETDELFYIWEVCQPKGEIVYSNNKKFLKILFN